MSGARRAQRVVSLPGCGRGRSFARAKRLGVSQSALSHAGQGLEEHIGVPCSRETTRSVARHTSPRRSVFSQRPTLRSNRRSGSSHRLRRTRLQRWIGDPDRRNRRRAESISSRRPCPSSSLSFVNRTHRVLPFFVATHAHQGLLLFALRMTDTMGYYAGRARPRGWVTDGCSTTARRLHRTDTPVVAYAFTLSRAISSAVFACPIPLFRWLGLELHPHSNRQVARVTLLGQRRGATLREGSSGTRRTKGPLWTTS